MVFRRPERVHLFESWFTRSLPPQKLEQVAEVEKDKG